MKGSRMKESRNYSKCPGEVVFLKLFQIYMLIDPSLKGNLASIRSLRTFTSLAKEAKSKGNIVGEIETLSGMD